MGGAIKAISNVVKSVTNIVQQLGGGLLKNAINQAFSMASSFTKALSPIAPKFFENVDKKLQSFQPKVMGAIDKGLAFANKVSNAATNVLGAATQAVQNFTPMGRQLAAIDF